MKETGMVRNAHRSRSYRGWQTLFLVMVFMGLNFSASDAAAEDLTGKQIMEKQEQLHKVTTEYGEEVMLLVDVKSGAKEKRGVKRYAKEMDTGLNRYLVVFLEPSDIRGTSLLTHENEAEDDQWLFLPAVKKMQRIAAGSKKSYFMGTDFTYEDMEPEDLENFEYTLIKSETIDHETPARDCYVVEAVPANKEIQKDSSYSKRIIWVDKENFVTHKIEFYDRRERLIKTQKAFEFQQVEGTIYRPRKTLMDNHKKDHKTLSLIQSRALNQPIDDAVFSERFVLSGKHIE